MESRTQTDTSVRKLWEIVKDKKPGVLWSVELQRAKRDLATEQQNENVRTMNLCILNIVSNIHSKKV